MTSTIKSLQHLEARHCPRAPISLQHSSRFPHQHPAPLAAQPGPAASGDAQRSPGSSWTLCYLACSGPKAFPLQTGSPGPARWSHTAPYAPTRCHNSTSSAISSSDMKDCRSCLTSHTSPDESFPSDELTTLRRHWKKTKFKKKKNHKISDQCRWLPYSKVSKQ